MRVLGYGSTLFAVTLHCALAWGEQAPEPEPPPPPPAPQPSPAPVPEPVPDSAAPAASGDAAPPAPKVVDAPSAAQSGSVSLTERRATSTLSAPAVDAPPLESKSARFARHYDALPLALEARFGVVGRLSSSFDSAAHEELLDSGFAFGGYLAWNAEYALGLEFEHAGLGRVRSLSGQNSLDAQYSASAALLGVRVFPLRRERFDLFVNLRVGLAFQHVDALGTRATSASITVPSSSFSCSEWDGPGFALGGALGAAYRVSRYVSVLSRIDATGERLSGGALGSCAEGMGSVATLSATVGLAFEFETLPK